MTCLHMGSLPFHVTQVFPTKKQLSPRHFVRETPPSHARRSTPSGLFNLRPLPSSRVAALFFLFVVLLSLFLRFSCFSVSRASLLFLLMPFFFQRVRPLQPRSLIPSPVFVSSDSFPPPLDRGCLGVAGTSWPRALSLSLPSSFPNDV